MQKAGKWLRLNIWVLIGQYSAGAIQWIPARQGLYVFQKSLNPCALDESSLSIERVKIRCEKVHLKVGHLELCLLGLKPFNPAIPPHKGPAYFAASVFLLKASVREYLEIRPETSMSPYDILQVSQFILIFSNSDFKSLNELITFPCHSDSKSGKRRV